MKIINDEHAKTSAELEISEKNVHNHAQGSIHKDDFDTNPKVRLINPCKYDVGRVAIKMKILDEIVKKNA